MSAFPRRPCIFCKNIVDRLKDQLKRERERYDRLAEVLKKTKENRQCH